MFNLPFGNSVEFQIGKEFLKLVGLYFNKDNELRKIFNKGTTKFSYSCMTNIKSIINSHNHKTLRCKDTTKTCNCKNKTLCPFSGECLFKATIINGNKTKEFYGSTGVYLKKRNTQHKHSFKSGNNPQTALFKYIRINSINNIVIIWSVINKVFKMAPQKSEMCWICNLERMAIAEVTKENISIWETN